MPPRRSARTTANKRSAAEISDASDAEPVAKPAPKKKPAAKKAKTAPADDAAPASSSAATNDAPATSSKAADTKMVTVIKRGKAPVDPKSSFVSTHQVYSDAEDVWDAALNQSDPIKNANKFYILQLLHPIGQESQCILFTRWGRVGEDGASQVKGPFSPSVAISEFKKQFKAKAAINWEQRRSSTSAAKNKYTWIERDFEEDKEEKASGSDSKDDGEPIPEPKMGPELQSLTKLIFNTKLIQAHLSAMNYDANKLPLGKLAKSTVTRGFAALKDIAKVIEEPNGVFAKQNGGFNNACASLTGAYYSIIPHAFGRTRPEIIDSNPKLKRELDLVDALGDMEVASKLMADDSTVRDADGKPINPLDHHLASLELSFIEPVTNASERDALVRYARETHGKTHHLKCDLVHAFRVGRDTEEAAWNKAGWDKLKPGERKLLWHGSRSTNFAGILKQGLRIAPPEAPATGYMFAKGVYFADMMTKSANYCHSHLSDNVGLMLLCETAIDPAIEFFNANYKADEDCKKAGKMATKGVGRTQPPDWQDAGETLGWDELAGCHMPKGTAADINPAGAYLQYNEYIVYNTNQIRVRYLLMFNMR